MKNATYYCLNCHHGWPAESEDVFDVPDCPECGSSEVQLEYED